MYKIKAEKIYIKTNNGRMPGIILSPKGITPSCGVLWIHGGGYFLGMKEMVYMSRAMDLVKKYGALVLSPGYRLAFTKPYPAAINDCYAALEYIKNNSDKLNVPPDKIMVGGESAGGGLAAALCIMARDKGEINIAFQMPLYPMIDNFDTPSSANNHGRIWNTKRNHIGWGLYLRRDKDKDVPPYAAPSREQNFTGLPPAYTFVGDGEPFYFETLEYIKKLNDAGIEAKADVYHTDMHAFDMLRPKDEISILAAEKFNAEFERALKTYFAPQK